MERIVVKVGGSTLGSHDTALEDIAALHREGREVIVVHGGGSAATEWLAIHGVPSEFVEGLRVTGAEAIAVVTAVFAGLVNKQLVAELALRGARAAGLSGVDGPTIYTRQLSEALGFVGEVTRVDGALVETLLNAGYVPVVAPLGVWEDSPAQVMNLNADTVAGELAAALTARRLVFLTDVAAVRGPGGRDMAALSAAEVEALIAGGSVSGGMVPKLRACARAAAAGIVCQIVDGRAAGALRRAFEVPEAAGTRVTA
jgi:acetylglutamate kinase